MAPSFAVQGQWNNARQPRFGAGADMQSSNVGNSVEFRGPIPVDPGWVYGSNNNR